MRHFKTKIRRAGIWAVLALVALLAAHPAPHPSAAQSLDVLDVLPKRLPSDTDRDLLPVIGCLDNDCTGHAIASARGGLIFLHEHNYIRHYGPFWGYTAIFRVDGAGREIWRKTISEYQNKLGINPNPRYEMEQASSLRELSNGDIIVAVIKKKRGDYGFDIENRRIELVHNFLLVQNGISIYRLDPTGTKLRKDTHAFVARPHQHVIASQILSDGGLLVAATMPANFELESAGLSPGLFSPPRRLEIWRLSPAAQIKLRIDLGPVSEQELAWLHSKGITLLSQRDKHILVGFPRWDSATGDRHFHIFEIDSRGKTRATHRIPGPFDHVVPWKNGFALIGPGAAREHIEFAQIDKAGVVRERRSFPAPAIGKGRADSDCGISESALTQPFRKTQAGDLVYFHPAAVLRIDPKGEPKFLRWPNWPSAQWPNHDWTYEIEAQHPLSCKLRSPMIVDNKILVIGLVRPGFPDDRRHFLLHEGFWSHVSHSNRNR